jgi:hypothetical protein
VESVASPPEQSNGRRLSAAADYLRRRYRGAPDGLCLQFWTLKGKRSTFLPVADLGEAESRLAAFCRKQAGDVYLALGLSPAGLGPYNRCEAGHVAGIPGLCADIDIKGPAHKRADLPATVDEALALANSLRVEPTEIVATGNGIQPWWLFNLPWPFEDVGEREEAADLSKCFWSLLQAQAKRRGWSLDSTYDLARLTRMPFTWNHKTDPALPVKILKADGPRYDPAELLALADSGKEDPFVVKAKGAVGVEERCRRYVAKIAPAVSGQRGHRQTYKVAQHVFVGFELSREAGRPIFREYCGRCDPPWSDKDCEHKIEQAITKSRLPKGYLLNGGPGAKAPASAPPAEYKTPPLPEWPARPEGAFVGLIGDMVAKVGPHSEADPVAILLSTLTAFGNLIGRAAHFVAEGSCHFLNEFLALLGETSKGRKGSSWGQVLRVFLGVDEAWATTRIMGGLSSAEGAIWQVRDAITTRQPVKEKGRTVGHEDVETDPGVSDKRLLVYESEFASVLRQFDRQGNTLSTTLRQAWETGSLRTLTKNSPAKATGAHVSLIVHCTLQELTRYLSATEAANGMGNRFLWACVRRSKLLPLGGNLRQDELAAMQRTLAEAAQFARAVGEMGLDDEAVELWCEVYPELSEGKPGLAGALLGRAEAHVRRLACLYALLDRNATVGVDHLKPALALWDYCAASVRHAFGDSTGDRVADDLLDELRARPGGMTRNEIREHFQRNRSSAEITRGLNLLRSAGLAHMRKGEKEGPKGRPAERWFYGKDPTR